MTKVEGESVSASGFAFQAGKSSACWAPGFPRSLLALRNDKVQPLPLKFDGAGARLWLRHIIKRFQTGGRSVLVLEMSGKVILLLTLYTLLCHILYLDLPLSLVYTCQLLGLHLFCAPKPPFYPLKCFCLFVVYFESIWPFKSGVSCPTRTSEELHLCFCVLDDGVKSLVKPVLWGWSAGCRWYASNFLCTF